MTDELSLPGLIERIAAGDQNAFQKLFEVFGNKLLRFAYSLVKTKNGAIEIVDEVFVKIWKQRERVPEIGNLKVYLYTATKNTALNYLSRKAHDQVTEPFDHINITLAENENPE